MFDLQGATTRLPATSSAPRSRWPYWYLRGLIAAREAYRYGGSPESLEPVKLAIAQLASTKSRTRALQRSRESSCMAASAAAQSEREEMGLLLEHALNLERSSALRGTAWRAGCDGARSRRETSGCRCIASRTRAAPTSRAAEQVGVRPGG